MPASFVEELMAHIMQGTLVPKVQIERVVGPILGMFLPAVLTEVLKDDPVLSGRLTMVCAEFPFKKDGNLQSDNIDWLLLNEDRDQVVFVELKTAGTSLRMGQCKLYEEKRRAVGEQGAGFLVEDFKLLKGASAQGHKYEYVLQHDVLPLAEKISRCGEAKILFLVPGALVKKASAHADRALCFSDLPTAIDTDFKDEWGVIREYLRRLDQDPKSGAPAKPVSVKPGGVVNYRWWEDLDDTLARCMKQGDTVVVGYEGGGASALARARWQDVEVRRFKCDLTVDGIPPKNLRNWMSGSTFVRAIQGLKSRHPSGAVASD